MTLFDDDADDLFEADELRDLLLPYEARPSSAEGSPSTCAVCHLPAGAVEYLPGTILPRPPEAAARMVEAWGDWVTQGDSVYHTVCAPPEALRAALALWADTKDQRERCWRCHLRFGPADPDLARLVTPRPPADIAERLPVEPWSDFVEPFCSECVGLQRAALVEGAPAYAALMELNGRGAPTVPPWTPLSGRASPATSGSTPSGRPASPRTSPAVEASRPRQ